MWPYISSLSLYSTSVWFSKNGRAMQVERFENVLVEETFFFFFKRNLLNCWHMESRQNGRSMRALWFTAFPLSLPFSWLLIDPEKFPRRFLGAWRNQVWKPLKWISLWDTFRAQWIVRDYSLKTGRCILGDIWKAVFVLRKGQGRFDPERETQSSVFILVLQASTFRVSCYSEA